jgi:hypothetical protein
MAASAWMTVLTVVSRLKVFLVVTALAFGVPASEEKTALAGAAMEVVIRCFNFCFYTSLTTLPGKTIVPP